MTGNQLKNKFYTRIGETEGASTYNTTAVYEFLNMAYEKLRTHGSFSFDTVTAYCTNPVTQLASATTAGATSIDVDDADGIEIGCPLVIDGEEQVVVTGRSSNTLTITPSLQNAYDIDDYVYGKFLILPYDLQDMNKMISLVRVDGTRALKEWRQKVDELFPNAVQPGVPDYYIQGTKVSGTANGAISSATATSGTNAMFNSSRYLNWLFVNISRNFDAYIIAINPSSNQITLDRSIAGQTSGDAFNIYLRKHIVELHPTPDAEYIWKVTYKRGCYPPIEASTSVDLPEDWITSLLDGAEAFAKARANPAFSQRKEGEFIDFIEQKLGDRHVGEDKVLSVSPWGLEELDVRNL